MDPLILQDRFPDTKGPLILQLRFAIEDPRIVQGRFPIFWGFRVVFSGTRKPETPKALKP